ncbi:MAG: peroxide stress protein YaaA [Gammaproteobacteria bacterium]|tara:strand:- start:39 stop:812 length:774 start_codon:yes stop_codon:yes gene_type:complete
MIIVLSPAKTLDYEFETDGNHSVPSFLSQSSKLIGQLKKKEPKDIASLMGLSDKLATLNYDRYQSWTASKKASNDSKPSLLVFKGDVYQGLQAEDLTKKEMNFAQKHVRILSGLYGILRPLDLMKPYRLEMGTKLETSQGKNLYEFWGDKIQKNVLDELKNQKSDLLINLASKEYFTVLGKVPEDVNVISPAFKDYKNGKYKIISFYAKKARGLMARWIIQNKVTDFENLKDFDVEGYKYSKVESTSTTPVFLRKQS